MGELKEYIESNWFATDRDAERAKKIVRALGMTDVTFRVPSLYYEVKTITYKDFIDYIKNAEVKTQVARQ
jgi:uncharacterized membrane protein YfhO